MRGRKPSPTALQLVKGRKPRRKREAKPRRVIPSPPEHLSQRALAAWGSLATRLDRLGLLTELDAFALEQLCENYGEILECRDDVRKFGRYAVVKATNGELVEKSRPSVAHLSDAERRFRAMMAEFGLTPSSRTRIETKPAYDGDSDVDPAAAYFS
jgi:P27 family predicted phage terminase small subunit